MSYNQSTVVVTVTGLAELRRSLNKLGPEAKKEGRLAVKSIADEIVPTARANVRHKPETLARPDYSPGNAASNIRSGTSGDRAIIRVPRAKVPYIGLMEFGGRFGIGLQSLITRAEAPKPIRRAIAVKAPDAAEAFSRSLEQLFRRHKLAA